MKKNTYINEYLADDMNRMGFLFEYCNEYALKLYTVSIDRVEFINLFMRSQIRSLMDIGHPKLLSQASQDTFEAFVEVDLKNDISKIAFKEEKEYKHYQLFWVGSLYAYIHYHADISSNALVEKLPLTEMLELYKVGHEMDISVFYSKVKSKVV